MANPAIVASAVNLGALIVDPPSTLSGAPLSQSAQSLHGYINARTGLMCRADTALEKKKALINECITKIADDYQRLSNQERSRFFGLLEVFAKSLPILEADVKGAAAASGGAAVASGAAVAATSAGVAANLENGVALRMKLLQDKVDEVARNTLPAQPDIKAAASFSLMPPLPKLVECTDADLEEFFQSKHKCQKLFLIRGKKIGLMYDPSGTPIQIPRNFISHPIIINSNEDITDEILKIISSKAPKNFRIGQHIMIVQSYNGRPFFEALGFEGTYFNGAAAKNFNRTFLTASPVFSELAKPRVPRTGVDAELEEFFKSTKLCQKRFVVDGQIVAIIFDPSGKAVSLPGVSLKTSWGSMTTETQSASPIVLLFEQKSPYVLVYNKMPATDIAKRNAIMDRILKICPEFPEYWYNQMFAAPEMLTFFGFDGPTPTQIAPIFTKAFLPPSPSK